MAKASAAVFYAFMAKASAAVFYAFMAKASAAVFYAFMAKASAAVSVDLVADVLAILRSFVIAVDLDVATNAIGVGVSFGCLIGLGFVFVLRWLLLYFEFGIGCDCTFKPGF